MFRRLLPTLAALGLVISSGVAHGLWTGRWSRSRELDEAIARVGRVPASFGGWNGKDFEINRAMLALAEVQGYVARRYRDDRGEEFTVLLVCGRPGPISLHTPDVCYEGAGYGAEAAPADLEVPAEAGEPAARFKWARFRGRGPVAAPILDICWSWNGGEGWEAPRDARMRFAAGRYLYKLYVVRAARPTDEGMAPGRMAFLEGFLSELRPALTPR